MRFALAIILDRIAVTRVVLNTRLHSCPLVFIRGFTALSRNYARIWAPALVLTVLNALDESLVQFPECPPHRQNRHVRNGLQQQNLLARVPSKAHLSACRLPGHASRSEVGNPL